MRVHGLRATLKMDSGKNCCNYVFGLICMICRIFKSEYSIKDSSLPKLYKIEGTCCSVLTQMEAVSWNKFTSNGIFLIHTPKTLFVWVGRAADSAEKLNAAKVTTYSHENPLLVTYSKKIIGKKFLMRF